MNQKENKKTRDYDIERKELFGNVKENIDPKIQKTIDLIDKLNNFDNQIKHNITISCSGTML